MSNTLLPEPNIEKYRQLPLLPPTDIASCCDCPLRCYYRTLLLGCNRKNTEFRGQNTARRDMRGLFTDDFYEDSFFNPPSQTKTVLKKKSSDYTLKGNLLRIRIIFGTNFPSLSIIKSVFNKEFQSLVNEFLVLPLSRYILAVNFSISLRVNGFA